MTIKICMFDGDSAHFMQELTMKQIQEVTVEISDELRQRRQRAAAVVNPPVEGREPASPEPPKAA